MWGQKTEAKRFYQICEALQLTNPYSKLFAVVFNLLERKYEPYTAFEAVHHHSKD